MHRRNVRAVNKKHYELILAVTMYPNVKRQTIVALCVFRSIFLRINHLNSRSSGFFGVEGIIKQFNDCGACRLNYELQQL